ncbi:MAG: ATP-grasp domain-containing protein, partial [Candidatus Thorarchaeota archaeon]|nr:ATP-grasp domain-containing protein [Candidatus Thorarchaeota archaeon]
MIPQKAMLKEKNIGIIGFNARPIACSIKALGGKTYVSDYWGDIDLVACSDEWTTVLAPKPGCRQRSSQERPIHLSLSDNFLSAFPDIEFDAILIGSGFDDHSSSLHRIQKNYGLSGNSPPMISSARNRKKIQSIINEDNLPARMPRSYKCRSVQHLLRSAIKVGFPCVVRPCTSGGGSGIRSFPDFETMAQYFDSRKSVELIVQEYIHGCDFSVSALGTGEEAKVLSIQSQL